MLSKASLIAASAVVLLALGGCTLEEFRVNVLGLSTDSNGHVVTGSLETVAGSTRGTLQQMGLFVTSNQVGDTIRLTSSTRTGRQFTLVLRRQKTDQGEQTRVSIEWLKDRDDAFWLELGGILVRGDRVPAQAAEAKPQVQESTPLPNVMTGAVVPGRP